MVVENELERAEKRIDVLTFENSKLKDEIRTYSNELKSFEAADEQYSERETQVGSSDHLQFFLYLLYLVRGLSARPSPDPL